jgi:hypothetical protein
MRARTRVASEHSLVQMHAYTVARAIDACTNVMHAHATHAHVRRRSRRPTWSDIQYVDALQLVASAHEIFLDHFFLR